jgi:histidinol dehydrogenase
VILLTPDAAMGSRVAEAVERQLAALPRAETARVALSASRIIVARDSRSAWLSPTSTARST